MKSFIFYLLIVLAQVIILGPIGIVVGLAGFPIWVFWIACCDRFRWFQKPRPYVADSVVRSAEGPGLHSSAANRKKAHTIIRKDRNYIEMPPIDGGTMTDLYLAQRLAHKYSKRKEDDDDVYSPWY